MAPAKSTHGSGMPEPNVPTAEKTGVTWLCHMVHEGGGPICGPDDPVLPG